MITIIKEIRLHEFEAWSGGLDTLKYLSHEEMEIIEDMIIDVQGGSLTSTQLNDILWFERDMIADWLGYETFEDIINR